MIARGRQGPVDVVRLDAPPLNLMGEAMIAAVRSAFEELASEGPHVVVLACSGAGANVRELAELDEGSARAFITALHEALAAVRAVDAPVVAAIDGPCLGAHMEMAAACDLRVCSPRSRFGMPEVRVGIPSVIEACLLPAICGLGEAARLVYEGEVVDAQEAARIGFVNRIVADAERDAVAWAERIAASGAGALRQQKRVVRSWTQGSYERAVAESIDHFADSFSLPETREALRSFGRR